MIQDLSYYYRRLFGEAMPDIKQSRGRIKSMSERLSGLEAGLVNYQVRRYDQEYAKGGMAKMKGQIAGVDKNITGERTMRDVSVGKVRKNPYYSAATITGETGEIEKASNAKINNMIDQRNSLAESYNSSIADITRRVATETQAKEREAESARYGLESERDKLKTYQAMRTQALSSWEGAKESERIRKIEAEARAEDKRRWEAEFSVALYSARSRGSGSTPKTLTPYQQWQIEKYNYEQEKEATERNYSDAEFRGVAQEALRMRKKVGAFAAGLGKLSGITSSDKSRALSIFEEERKKTASRGWNLGRLWFGKTTGESARGANWWRSLLPW